MNKIQNLIDLIAAEEAQQAKLKKLIAQSESNVRTHNAALERLRFPSQQVEVGNGEIKSKEKWRLIGREDIGELISKGDRVKISGSGECEGVYIVEDVDANSYYLPLLVSGCGKLCEWIDLDDEAGIYLKAEK